MGIKVSYLWIGEYKKGSGCAYLSYVWALKKEKKSYD